MNPSGMMTSSILFPIISFADQPSGPLISPLILVTTPGLALSIVADRTMASAVRAYVLESPS